MEEDAESNTLDVYLSSIQPDSTEAGDFVYVSLSPARSTLEAGEYSLQNAQSTDSSCGIDYNRSTNPPTFTELCVQNDSANDNQKTPAFIDLLRKFRHGDALF